MIFGERTNFYDDAITHVLLQQYNEVKIPMYKTDVDVPSSIVNML